MKNFTSIHALLLMLVMTLSACKDNRGMVVGKIKKASKLSTTEFTIEKIVFGVKQKKLLWIVRLTEAKFVAHSQAIVKTGVNLEKLQAKDVSIEGKKISLMLPPVEVINFSYPAERFVMDTIVSHNGFLNKIRLEEQEEYFRDAEIDIRESLQHMDIVEVTEKKTAMMLENMLKLLGYEEIYIDFQKSKELVHIPKTTP